MHHLKLFGITCRSLLQASSGPATVRFGCYSCLYNTPEEPLVLGYDDDGAVNAMKPLVPLTAAQYLPIAGDLDAPGFGEPYHLGLVLNAAKPNFLIGAWDNLATILCHPEVYGTVRDQILQSGEDGYHVARFLSHFAPKYAAGGHSSFCAASHPAELYQMELVEQAMSALHPDWVVAPGSRGFGVSR